MANRDPASSPEAMPKWPEPRLRALQVDDAMRLAPAATSLMYLASILAFGALVRAGDARRAAFWFLYATLLACLRAVCILLYRRRESRSDPRTWSRRLIELNFLSGILWALLGTVLFPAGPAYLQLLVLMIVMFVVAASIPFYAPVRGAHAVFAATALLPTVVDVFFVRSGVFPYAGMAALLLCVAMLHYAGGLHARLRRGYELRLENADLLALTSVLNEKLEREKGELELRAAVRGASIESTREQAERLSDLFEHSALPQLHCDASGRILAANRAAQRLFRRGSRELDGTQVVEWLGGRAASRIRECDRPSVVEVEALTTRGAFACSAGVTPLHDADGRRTGCGVILAGLPALVDA